MLLKAVICAGLYPNVFYINRPTITSSNDEITLLNAKETAYLHPTSVLCNLPVQTKHQWLVFHEKVKSSRIFVRDATFLTPYCLLLFAGDLTVHHDKQLITIDEWMNFKTPTKNAVIFKGLRAELDKLMTKKIESPRIDITQEGKEVVGAIINLLGSEEATQA